MRRARARRVVPPSRLLDPGPHQPLAATSSRSGLRRARRRARSRAPVARSARDPRGARGLRRRASPSCTRDDLDDLVDSSRAVGRTSTLLRDARALAVAAVRAGGPRRRASRRTACPGPLWHDFETACRGAARHVSHADAARPSRACRAGERRAARRALDAYGGHGRGALVRRVAGDYLNGRRPARVAAGAAASRSASGRLRLRLATSRGARRLRSGCGFQIRTGTISDPNGARYQAAPHPENAP